MKSILISAYAQKAQKNAYVTEKMNFSYPQEALGPHVLNRTEVSFTKQAVQIHKNKQTVVQLAHPLNVF